MYIFAVRGLASRRWHQLTSNVRPREKLMLVSPLASSPALMKASLRPGFKWRPRSGCSGQNQMQERLQHHRSCQLSQCSNQCKGASRQQPEPRSSGRQLGSSESHMALRFRGLAVSVSERLAEVHAGCRSYQNSMRHSASWPRSARSATTWPNPSLKPRPNGKTPDPRYSAGVLLLQRGPGVLPSVPA